MNRRILIIDDDPSTLELLRAELEQRRFEVVTQTSPEAGLELFSQDHFGVLLSDINMSGMSGVDLCQRAVALRQDTPVIVMTAFASVEAAVASIRAGAYDFVTKPLDADALALTIERALKNRELREEVAQLRQTVSELRPFDEMIGQSRVMKRMFDVVARVAQTDATALVSGESGTGKELVAHALHARSARAKGPFVAINCAAMPENLLESELFGHVKGAFTDAHGNRQGLFIRATGGTLFLDEVGEMPLGMQAKLLRALQERKLRPVGGDNELPFDVRVVAATNRDLEIEVEQKRFREDLFYRINVVQIQVPALRDRDNDVLLLAQSMLDKSPVNGESRVKGLTSATADILTNYPWPGNVRELQNCMSRAVAMARFDRIAPDDLPDKIANFKPPNFSVDPHADPTRFLSMEEVERRYIGQVLEALGGNKAAAAKALGVDRRTLYRKLDKWAAEPPRSTGAGADSGRA